MSELRKGAQLRAEAATVVEAVVGRGKSLDAALLAAKIPDRDRALLRLLCFGVVREHWRLRWQVRSLLSRPLKKRDSIVETLLSIGLYQIASTRIPDHAAVSMTVEAARLLRRPRHAGLVNAVLRNFMRNDIASATPDEEEAQHNHPAWLLRRLQHNWPDHWQQIVEANNARAPMWLRVNARRCSRARYRQLLAAAGASGSELAGLNQAVCLADPMDITELPGFAEGLASVQDGAAQLAAPWLLAGDGSRILDACAAPGGKTGHLLELAAPEAAVTALDADPERLQRVRQNIERLSFTATILQGDASIPEGWWDKRPFDRILLDAPCSGSGVIRRHPDIRLLRRDSDIASLAALQGRLLQSLWGMLEPGGRLLYVTCSVLADENDRVVADFLQQNADAREDPVLPNNNIRDLMLRRDVGYQLLPGTMSLDGFYYACLEKHVRTEN